MLGYHRDPKLPEIYLFIIRSGHESSSTLNESDCIDRAQMLFILLSDLTCVCIVLEDLLVLASYQEDVLSVV